MAILLMQIENSVFVTSFEGHVDKVDADQWFATLHEHASASGTPVIAILDFTKVKFISAPARITIAEATKMRNVRLLIVATNDLMMTQTARMISLLGEQGRMVILVSIEEARRYAAEHAAATS